MVIVFRIHVYLYMFIVYIILSITIIFASGN